MPSLLLAYRYTYIQEIFFENFCKRRFKISWFSCTFGFKLGQVKGFFVVVVFYVLYSTLFHLPALRFHCVGGCWDRTQDSCNYGIDWQTLKPLG
jgi:hypothetical protein